MQELNFEYTPPQMIKHRNLVLLQGILGYDDLVFLFDTEAACPVIGVN